MDYRAELIIERARSLLAYDDANPDVGMGMTCGVAINDAMEQLGISPDQIDAKPLINRLHQERLKRYS